MGPHKRVLLLGPTGVDKVVAGKRLAAQVKKDLGHPVTVVDFENEFLKQKLNVKNWPFFLAQDAQYQSAVWLQAWDSFEKSIPSEITILGLHATYVSGVLGLRCPINIPRICHGFKPTLIISLIDDVASMWGRTEARAQGKDHKGRPSFEQLLVARRAEQFLGDVLASHAGEVPARHVVCAAGNSIDALVNLIVFDAAITYLSFPISAPRKLAARGDESFVTLINEAHQLAQTQMRVDHSRAFISPLAIDELPLVEKAKKVRSSKKRGVVTFDYDTERWPLVDLWGQSSTTILPPVAGVHRFPVSEIKDASGVIRTDVGWRDRRLVLQSSSLAIVCPKPPRENRITRGVEEEIKVAGTLGIVCHYWQEPKWDPKGFLKKQFPAAGSMGHGQAQALVERKDSLADLIRAST